MDLENTLQGKEMEETKAKEADAREEGTPTKFPLPITTSSSPCSSPSHEFSFTISFHSPSAATATATKSPSALSRSSLFDLAPADDIFFHGHLLPLQLLSCPPPVSPRGPARAPVQDREGEQSRGHAGAADAISCSNSTSSNSSSSSGNGDAKERMKNRLLSSLFGGMGKWRKANEAGEREEDEDEKRRKRSAFDAMSRLLRRYVSAVEPLFSFRAGRSGGSRQRGDLRRRPYSFAGNPSAGAGPGPALTAAGGGREEWRRRRGELSAPASMRTSPSNSGILVAAPVGGSSDESTMEELQSAIESAIAHCKNSMIAMKEERCKC